MAGEADTDQGSQDLTADLMNELTGDQSGGAGAGGAAAGQGQQAAGAGQGAAAGDGAAAGGAAAGAGAGAGDGKDKAGAGAAAGAAGAQGGQAAPAKKPEAGKGAAAGAQGGQAQPGKGQQAAGAGKGKSEDFNPDDPKVTAVDLRKHLKRVLEEKNGIAQTVAQKEQQAAELQRKIDDFQKKRLWTDEDQKLLEKATKRQAELEANIYGRDYQQSPEYQEKYIARFNRLYKEGAAELVGMDVTVLEKGDDGEKPVQRKVTQGDIDAVVNAPANQRLAIAKKLFGEDRETVLTLSRDLNSIRKEANEAIESKQKNYESEIQQQSQAAQKANTDYQSFVKTQSEHFINNNPDIFSNENATPDEKSALEKGISFVDACANAPAEMPVNERAARAAVIRGMAAGFPRLLLAFRNLKAENTRLTEENNGYRASDPGNAEGDGGGGGGAGGGGGEEPKGSDELASEFGNV